MANGVFSTTPSVWVGFGNERKIRNDRKMKIYTMFTITDHALFKVHMAQKSVCVI